MKKRLITLLISFMLIMVYNLNAQENKSGIYFNDNRDVYIQANRPIYFYISTDTSQVPQRVDVNNGKTLKKYMQISKNGVHHIKHLNETTNKVEDIIINVDGISPTTKVIVKDAVKYAVHGTTFYDGNMKLALHATDNMSKIKNTYYSINNEPFKAYSDTLHFNKSGTYNFKYYSTDNVGNTESPKDITFNIDTEAPTVKLSLEGNRIDTVISAGTKIKLHAKDNFAGVNNIYYQIDGGKWQICKNNSVPTTNLEDDKHTLMYYAADNVENESSIKQFKFYLDKKGPLVSLIALGDKFVLNNKAYFSGRTKLVLIALDNKIGVDSIMYSIDNKEYTKYKQAFYLPSEQGQHTIKYYAIDKLGNKGAGGEDYSVYAQKSDIFIIDLLGPDISYKLLGKYIKRKNEIIVNKETKIRVIATDNESGLKNIKYSIDDDSTEINYEKDAKITEIVNTNSFKLQFSAYDNVNNRNILPISFIVDNEAPEIFHFFSVKAKQNEDGIPSIPAYSKLFLAAKDALSGIGNIQYSINGGKYTRYTKAVKGFTKNKSYTIKVIATDKLSNKNEYTIQFTTK